MVIGERLNPNIEYSRTPTDSPISTSQDAMNVDRSQIQKAQSLRTLSTSLASSISALSVSSRGLPSEKDFHFYNNFDEFKVPVGEISMQSHLMLEAIGSCANIWGKEVALPEDIDDAYDWLVNINDEVFERFDASVDEFRNVRKKEEESGRAIGMVEDGFQLVHGKKKAARQVTSVSARGKDEGQSSSISSSVKVATKDKRANTTKPKVPFHIPTIRRPQDEFNILANNSNQPFDHVWLERSEDGKRLIHPLEKLSVLDFVDKDIGDLQPVNPPSVESTAFKIVEDVNGLKELAAKLRGVNEFAVDLEHNQYRSFQGLTCLMQISTRTEDFIVDTLKLKVQVGPYLREIFKDPTKRKVMHGANQDIIWLQRDFGIYVCNLFDTGQASRVLKMERNSLEYLLHHFCGVTANKEYQNADWRLRPLPDDMLRYAREDTHYLLYIYDLMRIKLLSTPKELENSDTPLVEVYKRSHDICMHLYEKELLTEDSYLHIYGLQGADFNAQQLAIVAGLCEWRDVVGRAEDESTGFILPNKTLLEIAKQMPVTTSKLRRLVKYKHPYVERNLDSVVSIIRQSMLNAAAFEDAVKHLKEVHMEMTSKENSAVRNGSESIIKNSRATEATKDSSNASKLNDGVQRHDSKHPIENGSLSTSGQNKKDTITTSCMLHSAKVIGANVPVLNKPNRGLGALLGSSAPKRKLDADKKDKEELKLEKIRTSVNLPFHSFSGRIEQSKTVTESPSTASESQCPEGSVSEPTDASTLALPLAVSTAGSAMGDIIIIEDDEDKEGPIEKEAEAESVNEQKDVNSEVEEEDEPMSLSDLSSSFLKCLQPPKQVDKSEKAGGVLQVKPFDYEVARKEFVLGEDRGDEPGGKSLKKSGGKKKGSGVGVVERDGGQNDLLPQGRRRQAFPATGNRSATFR